jgi:hypothetical protein
VTPFAARMPKNAAARPLVPGPPIASSLPVTAMKTMAWIRNHITWTPMAWRTCSVVTQI